MNNNTDTARGEGKGFDLNAWLAATRVPAHFFLDIRKRVTCADGFSVSIQADAAKYCMPRENNGPYTDVELGFPSNADGLITDYAEDPSNPTKTVYPYVPVQVVEQLIAKHGGLTAAIAQARGETQS